MLPAIPEGKIKALYIIGENPVISDADSDHLVKAFQKLDFLVVQDIFLTETGQAGRCGLARGLLRRKRRHLYQYGAAGGPGAPGDSARWATPGPTGRLLRRFPGAWVTPWTLPIPEAIFEEIRQVTPSYAGITYARLETEGGLQWPCPTTDHPGTVYLHRGQFSRGKGAFFAIDHRDPAEMPDADYPLVYDHRAGALPVSYRHHEPPGPGPGWRKPRNAGWKLPPGTRPAMASCDGEPVRVKSRRGELVARALVSPKAVAGTIFIPFHFMKPR